MRHPGGFYYVCHCWPRLTQNTMSPSTRTSATHQHLLWQLAFVGVTGWESASGDHHLQPFRTVWDRSARQQQHHVLLHYGSNDAYVENRSIWTLHKKMVERNVQNKHIKAVILSTVEIKNKFKGNKGAIKELTARQRWVGGRTNRRRRRRRRHVHQRKTWSPFRLISPIMRQQHESCGGSESTCHKPQTGSEDGTTTKGIIRHEWSCAMSIQARKHTRILPWYLITSLWNWPGDLVHVYLRTVEKLHMVISCKKHFLY